MLVKSTRSKGFVSAPMASCGGYSTIVVHFRTSKFVCLLETNEWWCKTTCIHILLS